MNLHRNRCFFHLTAGAYADTMETEGEVRSVEYEGRICRAPMERGAYMLPVAVGCSYNACRFCTLFRHLRWRELPGEQIEKELQRVKQAGGAPRRVFLGDGNAFDLPAGRLLEILEMLRRWFPSVEGVNMDATVTGVAQKTDEELAALRRAGVECLYLGIESGLEDVLRFMNKDHTLEQAYGQIGRLRRLGYDYAAHIMTGVAGRGRGQENARALAEFLNRTKPRSVTNFSIFLHESAPLWQDIAQGRFAPADELENLLEERRLLELLEVDSLVYDGLHDMVEVRVRGRLPRDREAMLSQLDSAAARLRRLPPVYAFVK